MYTHILTLNCPGVMTSSLNCPGVMSSSCTHQFMFTCIITSEMQGIVGASKYAQTHGHALGHIHTHIATCLHTQLAQFSLQHIIIYNLSMAKQNHESIYRSIALAIVHVPISCYILLTVFVREFNNNL